MKASGFFLKTVLAVLAMSIFVVSSTAQNNKRQKSLQEVTFIVSLHCENCVRKVQDNIPFEKGVKDLKVNLEDKTVWIEYSPDKTDKAKLAAAIEKLGYEVVGEVVEEQ